MEKKWKKMAWILKIKKSVSVKLTDGREWTYADIAGELVHLFELDGKEFRKLADMESKAYDKYFTKVR